MTGDGRAAMALVEVRPGDAWLEGRRLFVHLLAEAAADLGGRLMLDAEWGHVGRFVPRAGPARPIFGNALGLNAEAAAMLAADKDHTARLLAGEGLHVPRGIVLFSEGYRAQMSLKNARVAAALPDAGAAERFARGVGYPVIVKPNSGSEGRGVHLCADEAELAADLATLFPSEDRVRLEEVLPGDDVRVTVLDGVVRMAYRRVPASVEGDGRATLGELARAALERLAAAHRGAKLSLDDARVGRALAAQGLGLGDVPEAGRRVRLLASANLSTGGGMEDLTDRLPEGLEALALRAAGAVGLRLAGVDLMVPDDPGRAAVLEVNAAPGLDYYAGQDASARTRALALVRDALRGGRSSGTP